MTPIIQSDRGITGLSARLVDACCVAWGLYLAAQYTWLPPREFALVFSLALVAYGLVAELSGLYRSWRGDSVIHEVFAVLVNWGSAVVALLTLGFLTRYTAEFARSAILIWFLTTPSLILLVRAITRSLQRWLRKKGFNTQRYAVIGVTDLGIQLAKNIEASPEMGMQLAGFFDDRPPERTPDLPASVGKRIGDLDELLQQTHQGGIDRIFITFPMRAEERTRAVLERFADTTASVYVVPDFFVFELLHSRWTNIGGLPAVSITETPFYGVDGLLKRVTDLVLVTFLLTMLMLPMTVVALLIKATSRGPIFFRQKRYGLDGREIRVWKFRSMTVCEEGAEVQQATKNDQRVTRLGAILRRTSIDELPQLFNVLTGAMSLVGPRPHATAHNEQYRSLITGYMLRHKVKPGLTGLAQVEGWRGETDTLEKMEKRVECDHQYIRQWSLWLDLKILLRTFGVVFSQKNAY